MGPSMNESTRQSEQRIDDADAWRLWLALIEQASHSAALERQLAAMKNSRSWRITAPLRAMLGWWQQRRVAESARPSLEPIRHFEQNIRHATDLPSWLSAVLPAEDDRPRLLLDVTELALEDLGAGVQRVTRRLLAELLWSPPDGYSVDVVRLTPEGSYCHARSFLATYLGMRADALGDDRPVVPRAGDRFVGLDFCRDRSAPLRSGLQSLRDNGATISLLVHDTLPLTHPHWFPANISANFESWLRVLSSCADQVICISEQTAGDLRRVLAERGLREPAGVTIFTLGADLAPSPDTPVLAGHDAGTLRVLTVGTIEPRKGYAQALAAFDELWASGEAFEWVIVGRPGWHMQALIERLREHPQAGRRLHWIEDADDRVLNAMYRRCDVLLMPSQGEGFGLPVAEAGWSGLGLLLRDLPVFHEVAGNAAQYFTGDSPGDIANSLRAWRAARDRAVPPRRSWTSWAQSAEALKSTVMSAHPPRVGSGADGRSK